MTHDPQIRSELSRDLNLFHVTMMGLGMMIGAGVFVGIGSCIAIAGPGGVMLTFVLNGLLALFTAMSYAELSSAIPRAGGAYNFARIAFGRRVSFIAGWMEWFASSVAGSLYAVTFALYTVRFVIGDLFGLSLSPVWDNIVIKAVAVLTIIFFIGVNYRGASETGKLGALVTLGQTLFMLIIGVMGIVVALNHPERLHNFSDFMPEGWGRLLITMGIIYVAFEGFEVIAQAGDEVVNPRKNLPKAMLYSVLVVTFTYILVTFATVVSVGDVVDGKHVVPWRWIGSFKEEGFRAAIAQTMPFANLLLTLAVIFSSTSALNATLYSATRAAYALGRDRMLPKIFAAISPKRKTPYGALLATGVIVIIIAALLPTMQVAASASIMFLVLFFLVNLCVIRIRRNMRDELSYGFLMPLFPLFPILAILCQIVLAAWMHEFSPLAVAVAALWVLGGFMIYSLYSSSRAEASEDEIQVFEERREARGSGFKLMMAVANPENALSLAQNAYRIGKKKNVEAVDIVHMVQVPQTVSLLEAEEHLQPGRESIGELMLYLGRSFKVNSTLRYCRNVARGIVSCLREKRSDLLLMGWHGRSSRGLFTLGSTIDPILENSPCDVAIFSGCGDRRFNRILVPVAGGPNSVLALEMALLLAEKGALITACHVAREGEEFNFESMLNKLSDLSAAEKRKISFRSIESNTVADALMRESQDHELIVIGCTRKGMLSQVFSGSLPEELAGRTAMPLVMVNSSRGLSSWIRRWF